MNVDLLLSVFDYAIIAVALVWAVGITWLLTETMSELPPMDAPSEVQKVMQSFQHSFDERETQLVIRQTALIQARELMSHAMNPSDLEVTNSADAVMIANITLEMAQVFEHYLATGVTLHDD